MDSADMNIHNGITEEEEEEAQKIKKYQKGASPASQISPKMHYVWDYRVPFYGGDWLVFRETRRIFLCKHYDKDRTGWPDRTSVGLTVCFE